MWVLFQNSRVHGAHILRVGRRYLYMVCYHHQSSSFRGKTAAPAQAQAKRLRVRKKKPADPALRKKVAKPKKVAPAKPAAPASTLKTKAKAKPRPKPMTKAEIAKARAEKLAAKAAKPKVKPQPKKAPAKEEAGAKKLPAVPEILMKRRKRRVAAKKHKIAAIIQVSVVSLFSERCWMRLLSVWLFLLLLLL